MAICKDFADVARAFHTFLVPAPLDLGEAPTSSSREHVVDVPWDEPDLLDAFTAMRAER